jgi:hypothetical protein
MKQRLAFSNTFPINFCMIVSVSVEVEIKALGEQKKYHNKVCSK